MPAKYLLPIALFLVGGVALVLPSGYSLGFYVVCFTGLVSWFKVRSRLIAADTQYFFWPLLTYALGHGALALNEKWAAREFENYLPFVLTLFGVWSIRQYKPRAEWFFGGLAVGAIGAAVFAGYQAIVLGLRAGGHVHPIQFGNVALLMGVLCMVRAMVVFRISWFNLLMWMGFCAGVVASIWSQTRGGWLAVLLVFMWILVNANKEWAPAKRVMAVLALLTLLAIPALQPNGVVQSRIAEAAFEAGAYLNHGNQDTSVGARLAMWSIAIDGIAHAPFLGQGNQGWIATRDAAIAEGRLSSFSAEFTHLHNEYLNVIFKRGLVGLALYLALYLVPMLMFFKPYLHDDRPDLRVLAMAGMVIPMMFMDFGLSQTFLSHNSGRIVLCSFWMCVAALMLNTTRDNESHDSA